MYNNFGEGKYVIGVSSDTASLALMIIDPWYMKLMFVISGIAARYSLDRRSGKDYVFERFLRVGLPFLIGMLLLIPFMAYIGSITNTSYDGGYFAHYKVFFSGYSSFNSWDGKYSTAHLWFLEYLLIISLVVLPLYFLCKKYPKFFGWSAWPMPTILLLGVVQAASVDLIAANNYVSFSQCFFLFLIGKFVIAHEEVQAKLEKNRFWLSFWAIILLTVYLTTLILNANIFKGNDLLISWAKLSYAYVALLALIGQGRRYLNTQNKFLIYASNGSLLIFIFHYPVLVAVAFVFMPLIDSAPLQFIAINIVAFILTFFIAEIVRATPFVRTLFGMKRAR
jgi:peptidoglycan/LPS O-acetylase OafA/YrhL